MGNFSLWRAESSSPSWRSACRFSGNSPASSGAFSVRVALKVCHSGCAELLSCSPAALDCGALARESHASTKTLLRSGRISVVSESTAVIAAR
jgi:hypothetical protein